jgi:hypothetical protein
MSIKALLSVLAALFSLPAAAHLGHGQLHLHQTEYLLWLLGILSLAWLLRPVLRKVIMRTKLR